MQRSFSVSFALAALELHFARMRVQYISLGLALIIIIPILWYFLFLPPAEFPVGKIISIPKDESVYQIATELANEHVISSPRSFVALIRILGTDTHIAANRYVFPEPSGLLTVVWRIILNETGITAVRVRLIEGMTARDMSQVLDKAIPEFSAASFLIEARPLEGYLFPDTYFIYPGTPETEIVSLLYLHFTAAIQKLKPQISASRKSELEIVTMASLLEREARSLSEKRMVAGILWNRIKKGMPLQVDAVFGYIKDSGTYSPSLADLKIDSPYNTYTHKGLPPGPIANPGYDSLLAAVTPATTTHLYYLTGNDGYMHYAKTFAEHKRNRALYLR